MALGPGIRLGAYEILSLLGTGGMGEVYRAKDTKLNRIVAIKVLPETTAANPERRARFERETQTIAALTHPNIVTIYSVEEAKGVLFLTMEFVEGKPLSDLIVTGGLPLTQILTLAIPLADAISAAHQKSITHRDLKPANVMVSTDGRVKVLDFGLAKLMEASPVEVGVTGLPTEALTGAGRIVGTVAYMSPEQAEGKAIDHRSDLFSLGVVLYELATGDRPFKGDTSVSVISSIIKDTPRSVTDLQPSLPRELSRIIKRCLVKDVDRRYQTAKDVRNELEDLKQEYESGERLASAGSRAEAGTPVSLAKRRNIRVVTGVGALVLLAMFAYLAMQRRDSGASVPLLTNPMQVAASIGVETYPSWSPDGHMLAYQSDQAGNEDIWITQIGGGPPVNRTADHPGNDREPRWSPDGRQIAFWSSRDRGGIFVMPALAGGARKVAPSAPGLVAAAAWSPDGSELAYPIWDEKDEWLECRNLQKGTARRIALPLGKGNNALDLTWSPDGRFVAFVEAPLYTAQVTRLWVMRGSDAAAHAVTDGRMEDWSPSWSPDARTLYFTSNRSGTRDLWQQRIADDGTPIGATERITTGMDVMQAALSADGKRVAYAKGRRVANVWRVPILPDRTSTWSDAQQVTFDQAHIEYFDLSVDAQSLAVQSDRSGNPDIWILPAVGGDMQQLTSDPTPDWAPAWSPDGREVAFYAYRTGKREVWTQPIAGGPAHQLTRMPGQAGFPRWSLDGRMVFFTSAASSGKTGAIWVVPVIGGEPRQVVEDATVAATGVQVSSDGQWIAFTSSRSGESRIWRVPVTGGEVKPVTRGQGSWPVWSPDMKWIYFTRDGNVWRTSLDGAFERPMTNFAGKRGSLTQKRTDGRYLYFAWRDDIADIWAMDVVRGSRR